LSETLLRTETAGNTIIYTAIRQRNFVSKCCNLLTLGQIAEKVIDCKL